MIHGFCCKETEALFNLRACRRWQDVAAVALRKLNQLDASGRIEDLRIPPGNRLEALRGDREGQHSIRINDQWRVCFRWVVTVTKNAWGKETAVAGAYDVEIVDYH